MSIDLLIDSLPGYAKDLKLNYSSLVRQNTELTPQQLWGTVVATAIATRNPELTAAVIAESEANGLNAGALDAAKAAAAIMGMNNVYYRFHHLTSNEKY